MLLKNNSQVHMCSQGQNLFFPVSYKLRVNKISSYKNIVAQ